MKRIYSLFLCLSASWMFCQIGINTPTPNATLDVLGQPANTSKLDGFIPPRITGDQLRAKTYTSSQTGAIVYVTVKDSAPAGQTVNVLNPGYYFFNGTVWVGMAASNAFVPSVVAAGRATNVITQADGTFYTKWSFNITRNDGNWNTITNSYTVPSSGYYQVSLTGKVTVNNGSTNYLVWLMRYGTVWYSFHDLRDVPAGTDVNSGGVVVLYLTQGMVIDFGASVCSGCTASYSIDERTFSIISLGS